MKITRHALDVYSGKPAKGLKVDVYFISIPFHHYPIIIFDIYTFLII